MAQRDRTWSQGVGTAAPPVGPAPLPGGLAPPPSRGLDIRRDRHRGRAADEGFGRTERRDAWWAHPALQLVGALIAVGYAAWAAPRPQGSEFPPYHSPFHAHLFNFTAIGWFSPALINLAIPVFFRATCYYFRRSYYRSFFADPAACAVGEFRKGYGGETVFPFVIQNLHRYALYLAMLLMIVHWTNVVRAFAFPDGFGIGFGTLLLLADTTLLTGYTLSCHALRHLVGGNVDCFSCAKAGGARHKSWSFVSFLNLHHMGFFWWSLYTLCAADLYIRLCAAGVIHETVWHPIKLFTSAGGVGL